MEETPKSLHDLPPGAEPGLPACSRMVIRMAVSLPPGTPTPRVAVGLTGGKACRNVCHVMSSQ